VKKIFDRFTTEHHSRHAQCRWPKCNTPLRDMTEYDK